MNTIPEWKLKKITKHLGIAIVIGQHSYCYRVSNVNYIGATQTITTPNIAIYATGYSYGSGHLYSRENVLALIRATKTNIV